MKKTITALAILASALSTLGYSNEAASTATPSSGVTAVSMPAAWTKNVTASYSGVIYGSPLSDITSPYTPTTDGKLDTSFPTQIENQLGAAYKITDTLKVGAQLHFFYKPVMGQEFTMKDPQIQLTEGSLISAGNFKMSAYTRVYLPFTDESNKKDRLTSVRFFVSPSYAVSDFTFGVYGFLQPSFYGTVGSRMSLTAYMGPNVNYQLNKDLGLWALYEIAASHSKDMEGITSFGHDSTNLQVGASYDVLPGFNLSPYILTYPSNSASTGITWDNTSINLSLSAKLM